MLGALRSVTVVSWARGVVARGMLLAFLSVVFSGAANAQLNVVIIQGLTRPVPIAIVPFGWSGGGPPAYDIAGVVSSDLKSSGRFAPLPVADMVSRPTQPDKVNFTDWRLLKVDYVLIGTLTETTPDQFTTVFQLFDVLKGEQILGYRFMSARVDLRPTAHKVSDMIFEKLVGIPGVFSTQIAYVSEEKRPDGGKRFRLIVSDVDGENAKIVADSPQPLLSPSWSPDGRRLAYASFEGDQESVFVQTLRTGTRERVSARRGVNSSPAFSPDGRLLAITLSGDNGNLDIFTLDLATQVLRQLTTDAAIDTEATWSPDGRTIFFNSDRSGGPQIYKVGAEPGSRAQRVTFDSGPYNARPRLSPDGKLIAVVNGANNTFQIGVFDAGTGMAVGKFPLTNGKLDESPSFAPNGAQIIYAARVNGRGVLASVTTDGRIQQQIASVAGDVREPVWGPYPRP
jgi:TolB protein